MMIGQLICTRHVGEAISLPMLTQLSGSLNAERLCRWREATSPPYGLRRLWRQPFNKPFYCVSLGSPSWRPLPGSKAFGLQQPTGYHLFTIHSYLLLLPTQVGDAGQVRALAYRYRVGSVSVCGTALPAPGFLHVSSRAG